MVSIILQNIKRWLNKIEYISKSDVTNHRGLGHIAVNLYLMRVLFIYSFVMLLNFQRYGKMKGMGKVVEWSIRDESI